MICQDLEAQPSLEPEENEQDNEEDEESFPLLQETKFDGSLQQSGTITGTKSLRRQSRSEVNVLRRNFSLNSSEC